MDIDYYERVMREMYEAKCILNGLDDIENGRVFDGETVISEIREKYGL